MLKRNEKGRLSLNTLDVQCMFDNMFAECRTVDEVEWLQDLLGSCLDVSVEDMLNDLDEDDREDDEE